MAIHLSALPGVLFKPTETFNRLKSDANLVDGLKLYVLASVLTGIVSLIFAKLLQAKLATVYKSLYNMSGGRSTQWVASDLQLILSLVIDIAIGIVAVLALAWLASRFAKWIAKGKGDFSTTFCLFVYLGVAVALLISLPLNIIFKTWALTLTSDNYVNFIMSMSNPYAIGSFLVFLLIVLIVGILLLVWMWILYGKAVAAANDVSLGISMLSVFLTCLVFLMIVFLIGFIIGLALPQIGAFSPTGYALVGMWT